MTVVDKQNPERHFTDASFGEYGLDEADIDSDPDTTDVVSENGDAATAAVRTPNPSKAKGGSMIRENAELSDDPILVRIAEDQRLCEMIRKVRRVDVL